MLTSADFEVIEAVDGEAGLAAAAAHRPDLILMDMQLPILDGYEATRRRDQTYKNHLDGYNQMALLEGKGPSARHEIFYFGGAELGAVRVDNFKYQFYTQPDGWPGPKVTVDMPLIYNIRQDPFERTPILNFSQGAPAWFNEFFGREAWRFVYVQQVVAQLGETAIEYPPMQAPASFNLTNVKAKIEAAIKSHNE